MKPRPVILGFVLFILALSLFSQNQRFGLPARQPASSPSHQLVNYYDRQWKKVDSLSNLGLPKSALAIVNKIHDQAKSEKNDPQYIKSVIFGLTLRSQTREESLALSIREIKAEIKDAREPVRQILCSLLAEIYQTYYQNNRYRFEDRTQVLNNTSDSIQTWDLKTLSRATLKYWMLSMQNPALLQSLPIGNYDEILLQPEMMRKGNLKTTSKDKPAYRPTLYDFLCWRALEYFVANESLDKVNVANFTLDKNEYFQQAKEFSALKLELPRDSSSLLALSLKTYQDLAAFHLGDKDPRALVDEEIHRFGYLKEYSIVSGKDSIYLDALKKLEITYSSSPSSTDVSYSIASFLQQQGSQYRPAESPKFKWKLLEAMEYCRQAIKRFPESDGAANCRMLSAEILKPALEIQSEYAVVPDKPFLSLIDFKNLKTLYFRLAKTNPETDREKTMNRSREDLVSYYSGLAFQNSWVQELHNDGDFQSHSMEIRIPGMPVGYYILLASSDPAFKDTAQVIAWEPFYSTQISYISHRNEKNEEEFYLLDRETGSPLKNVKAEASTNVYNYNTRKYENKKLGEYVSDDNGHFLLPVLQKDQENNNLFLEFTLNDDIFGTGNFYRYPAGEPDLRTVQKTWFFTDRGIYRPGQTVYFKGILLEKKEDNFRIKAGAVTSVIFTDANNQKITEQDFTTNEFGSFNGSFEIPLGLLPGTMKIWNGSGYVFISVEEYKRPTFEVSFEPVEGNYRLGDSVTLTGKAIAYAGNNLDGASVKFRVVRSARFPFWERGWWFPMPSVPETEILQGIVKTTADGSFTVKFKAVPDLSVGKSTEPVFDYVVSADVTDINGETQSASESVTVGYVSLLVSMDVPEKLDPARDTLFHLTSTNLNGRKTPTVLTLSIRRLQQPGQYYRQRLWEMPDLPGMNEKDFRADFPHDAFSDENLVSKWPAEDDILKKELNTASDTLFRLSRIATRTADGEWMMEDGRILKQGNYLLTLKGKDPYGETVEQKIPFVVYHPDASGVPVPEMDWFVPLKTRGEPGEKAVFLLGSKAENVTVLYEIRLKDSLFSRQWLKLSNNQKRIEIPILEKFRGNFTVNFVFIRFNRLFQHSVPVYVPYTSRKLDITFETFRNKLNPGQEEEWKIRIVNAAKKGVSAEYLTAMYDASLDVFAPNSWSFSVYRDYYWSPPWEVTGGWGFRISSGQYYPLVYTGSAYLFPTYEELNWFGFGPGGGGNYRRFLGANKMSDRSSLEIAPMAVAGNVSRDETAAEEKNAPPAPPESAISTQDTRPGTKNAATQPGIQIRRDFRETAFFYPSLVTDSAGNLDVKFTVPESLTKWKILGLAYTKQLEIGSTEKELITHKDLMVFPNSPRFVRMGDTLVFSAKVVNLSDRALNGEVTLELTNSLTQKPVSLLVSGNPSQSFVLSVGQSSSFRWKLAIPDDPSLSVLQYRITAKAGNFSDGEEKAFPVLPNRTMVTEALPLPVRGKGPVDFKFDKLLNSGTGKTLKNYKLTLEFASNPVWYAVQALPTMDDPRYPNADGIFRSFYTNSIAYFLANSNPEIKKVFESWTSIPNDALVSNLIKNAELKSALIRETPWVMESQDETQRKHRLSLFFDRNNMEFRLNQNLKKLQKMQTPSGGWPWFDGMPENRYITQDIVTGLGHLGHLGIRMIRNDNETWNMLSKAVAYLDDELVKDYNQVKKLYPAKMEENHLGETEIQYLYARSYYLPDIPLNSGELKTAFQYFQHQAEKYWLQNDLYGQGMTALALNRLGNKTVPEAILMSLSEKALHSPEMGMYWATQGGYEWYQAPVETQSLLIEAYEEIAADPKPVDEMKVWLLKQKQTQDWKTGHATAEACYALLLRGTDLLSEQPEVKIGLGKEIIDPQKLAGTKVEAGTGYFQVYRNGSEITPEMGNITISKSNESVAWGALYWQYFEDLDKITPHSTPLKLEKKLFIERVTPTGKVLEPLPTSEGGSQRSEKIEVGDKIIVRIILSVDRDLEFVHMKDLRASAFEPLVSEQMSGYRYQDGLGYYQAASDISTDFFFDYLPKGTWVFEYPLRVNAAGDYSNGITTVQSMYTPEFGAHSEGTRVKVGK